MIFSLRVYPHRAVHKKYSQKIIPAIVTKHCSKAGMIRCFLSNEREVELKSTSLSGTSRDDTSMHDDGILYDGEA